MPPLHPAEAGMEAAMEAESGGVGPAWLEEALRPRIAERDLVLVFPSQAVADAWALEAPTRFGLGAVETDRFIGWDRFKEAVLQAKREEKPADRLARTVWAAGIVARQGKDRFLKRIAGPGKPTPAFVPFLAKLPPGLRRVATALRALGTAAMADEGLADLLVLEADYAAFLERHRLFEPGWEAIEALPGGSRWLLIAPALMEDFAPYEERLKGLAPRVGILELPRPGLERPPLLAFDNAYEELRWTFLEAGRLLDEGLAPADIVVTVAGLESNTAWVERAARLAGIPVAIKGGSSLADSPFGRLLREAGEAAARGFDFDAFRPLLLDRFVRWKDSEAVAGLIRFGIDYHAYASYSENGKRVDVWRASFASRPGSGGLDAFYVKLAAALRAIHDSGDFGSLRKAIFAFRGGFLDESHWSAEEERIVERALVELEGLARTEAALGAVGSLESPFSLYLAHLGETTYVAQASHEGGAAIAVYPYRVSALHPARRHFVLGAGQDAIRVSYASLPFLREDQKAALGCAEDRDASSDFALAYALSAGPAGAGRGSTFSFATEGFSGWSVPHPFFTPPVPGGSAAIAPPAEYLALRETCPVRAEAAAWRGENALPSRLLAIQREAFGSAKASLACPASRFTKDKAGAASLAAISPRTRTKDGSLRLSATALREYLACPFAWLLSRGLKLEAEETGVGFFDALLAGDMAHDALHRLLDAMGAMGTIRPSLREDYLAAVDRALAETGPAFVAKEGPFLEPMFEAYLPLLRDRLKRHVDFLVSQPGWEAGDLEVDFERPYPERGLVLQGRMDRLALRPGDGARAIIDYKKRNLPKAKDLRVDASGGLGDYQVAAYVALCDHAGLELAEAWYWSIEAAKALHVLGGETGLSRADYDAEIAALETALAEVGDGIAAGDFGMARESSGACSGCDWKAICRARWATE